MITLYVVIICNFYLHKYNINSLRKIFYNNKYNISKQMVSDDYIIVIYTLKLKDRNQTSRI